LLGWLDTVKIFFLIKKIISKLEEKLRNFQIRKSFYCEVLSFQAWKSSADLQIFTK